MATDNQKNAADSDELNIKKKRPKRRISIDAIIRGRIDDAIIAGDEKEAKLQLEILEKYLKTKPEIEAPKAIDYKTRRANRDKLMETLLARFEKLQNSGTNE